MDSVSLVRVQVDDDCCVKLHQFLPHVLTKLLRTAKPGNSSVKYCNCNAGGVMFVTEVRYVH